MGSREDVASKIDVDTKRRIDDMNKAVQSQKEPVSGIFVITFQTFFVFKFFEKCWNGQQLRTFSIVIKGLM